MRLIAVLLFGACGFAQSNAPAPPVAPGAKSALDKATLENYLRYVELFLGAVDLKIDDPKPSKYLPGFSEVAVHLSNDNGSKDELYYVSQDGQTIIQGDPSAVTVFNVAKSVPKN